jgi:hypothetical protein
MTLFGMPNFGPLPGGGGGGPSGPDGTLPTFTTMSALDAGLTVVGRRAQLVGATTGEVILTCVRRAAGAGGLAIEGPVTLWQADGTEFDSSWAWQSLGAAAAVTWGVAGDEATGGLIPPVGTVMLGGFRRLQPFSQRGWAARWRVDAVPAAPATGMCLAVGVTPADQNPQRLVGGGVGYSTVNYRNIVVTGASSYDAPTISAAAGANLVPPALPYTITSTGYSGQSTGSTNVTTNAAAVINDDPATGGLTAGGSLTTALAGETDLNPTVTRVGDWTARLLSISWPAEAA